MGKEGLIVTEDPESLRAQVLETLPEYQIRPENPIIRGLSYGPDYIEFVHQCHNLGDRWMRVKGDEVYIEGGAGLTIEDKETMGPGLVRIDLVDEWETTAGYAAAMLYDPRWLLARLKDLELTHKETTEELKGNLYPHELGIMPLELESLRRDVEGWSQEELIQGLIEVDTNFPRGRSAEQLQRLKEEYLQLSEEELREKAIKEATKPWGFLVEVDRRNLPISITQIEGFLILMPEETGETIRFNYIRLPTQ